MTRLSQNYDHGIVFTALLYVVLIGGCASVQTKIPVPTATQMQSEQDAQAKAVLARFSAHQSRLDRIATKILRANVDQCPKTRSAIGLRTHHLKSYPKQWRDYSKQWLATEKTPAVLSVQTDSRAEHVGIRAGDVLVDDQNKPVNMRHKQVQAILTSDNPTVRVRRGDNPPKLYDIAPYKICDYPLRLRMSGAVNAYATGKSIIVTTGMMDFVNSDGELAMIIAHELAHNTHHHVRKSIQNIILSVGAKRTVRPFESEADYVGLYYLARAGYDLGGIENIWNRLGQHSPKSIVRAKTHPITPKRFLALQLTRDEIHTKQRQGLSLIPNAKP